jgi:hypothetical protein
LGLFLGKNGFILVAQQNLFPVNHQTPVTFASPRPFAPQKAQLAATACFGLKMGLGESGPTEENAVIFAPGLHGAPKSSLKSWRGSSATKKTLFKTGRDPRTFQNLFKKPEGIAAVPKTSLKSRRGSPPVQKSLFWSAGDRRRFKNLLKKLPGIAVAPQMALFDQFGVCPAKKGLLPSPNPKGLIFPRIRSVPER